jgi:hypothetical protein
VGVASSSPVGVDARADVGSAGSVESDEAVNDRKRAEGSESVHAGASSGGVEPSGGLHLVRRVCDTWSQDRTLRRPAPGNACFRICSRQDLVPSVATTWSG